VQKVRSDVRVQIFATDVSDVAIEHARAGVYSTSIADDVGRDRLRRFFTKTDGHYRINKVIRDLCVFAKQDITTDPPFSRLDLISCRNVLIYMDAALQKKLMALFHYALNPTGYLMLGHAETVGAQVNLFALVDKKHRIHRKKSVAGVLPMTGFPRGSSASVPLRKRQPVEAPADKNVQIEISRAIVNRFAPSGVVVDNDMQIVMFRGHTGDYLEPSPGEASLNLLKMVREGLLHALRAAFHQARKSRAAVRKEGLHVRHGDQWKPVALEVLPLSALSRPHFLVLFEQASPTRAAKAATKRARPGGSGRADATEGKILLLQRELAASKEYLQSIIQESEAANEELQSANEEILSSNEELQSTNEELDTAKEELQSTNEELNTVNEELQGRNQEMGRINSDLVNLVASVQIAIVIVSGDLRIRRFTPMAERILNLIPGDLDRSIGHINPNIVCPNLEQLIIECMESVSPVERDVQDRQGHWYSLRIRPYKSLDNKIDGAVLALFDIDSLKRSEQRVAMAQEFCGAVLRWTPQPLALIGEDLRVEQANSAFAALLGATAEELRGRGLDELTGRAAMVQRWRTPAAGTPLPPIHAAKGNVVITGEVIGSPESPGVAILASAKAGR
jgi:two-component system CheB/CheR fusion protein